MVSPLEHTVLTSGITTWPMCDFHHWPTGLFIYHKHIFVTDIRIKLCAFMWVLAYVYMYVCIYIYIYIFCL